MILTTLYAIFVLAVGLGSLFVAGLPLCWWTFNRTKKTLIKDAIWGLAPFAGYALIYFVLKIPTVLNIPVQYTAFPLLAILVIFFVYTVLRLKKENQLFDFLPSKKFLLLLGGVVLIAGLAYFIIGATYYKGYMWYDMIFYGTHAEMLRSVPFSQVEQRVAGNAWLSYSDGTSLVHRMAIGLVQAFVATITFCDGAATIGFISILSCVLVFCAMIYVTRDIAMKANFRLAACFFAAVIPNVIRMELEAFIGIALFTSFAILMCRLFLDVFKDVNLPKTLLAALIASASFCTLSNGLYIVVFLVAFSFMLNVLSYQAKWKSIVHLPILYVCLFLFTIPLISSSLKEITAFGSADSLNYIYDFAFTPQAFTFAFFGTNLANAFQGIPLTGLQNLGFMAVTFAALSMAVLGLYGLISIFFKTRRPEGVNFIAMIFIPLVFLLSNAPSKYSFFKTFAFAVPLFVFGIWYVGNECYMQLSEHFLVQQASAFEIGFKKFTMRFGTALLSGLFVVCTACGMICTLQAVLPETYYYRNEDNRIFFARHAFNASNSKAHRALYTQLSKTSGENLLMASGDGDLGYWWMTYYARNNTIYGLTEEIDDIFQGVDNGQNNIDNIPLDVKLQPAIGLPPLFTDPALLDDYMAIMQTVKEDGTVENLGVDYTNPAREFNLRVFARKPATATLSFKVDLPDDVKQAKFKIGNETCTVTEDGGVVTVPIVFQAGGQVIPIEVTTPKIKCLLSLIQIGNVKQ